MNIKNKEEIRKSKKCLAELEEQVRLLKEVKEKLCWKSAPEFSRETDEFLKERLSLLRFMRKEVKRLEGRWKRK